MDLDVTPEPEDELRRAIDEALRLRREQDERACGASAWWRAGVEESVRADLARE